MSVENDHGYACTGIHIPGGQLAKLRQELYDAKLALASGDKKKTETLLTQALDTTQRWT